VTRDEVSGLLGAAPWWVAGRQAIDVFLGQPLGPGPLTVLVPRRELLRLLPDATESPVLRGDLRILIGDQEAGEWFFQRKPTVRRPVGAIGERNAEGLPYLRPEIALLLEAHEPDRREDLERALPAMHLASRAFLAWGLVETWPGHPWLPALLRPA